ncbi:hypothetical protein KR009_007706 [Drosophila setifemur]|nr:hypothetical protein KR009_007706 [Drosophila setifemur]
MAQTDLDTSVTSTDQDHSTAGEIGHVSKPFLTNFHDGMPRNAQAQATTMALEQYRLQLYNYALNIERFRCPQYGTGSGGSNSSSPWVPLNPYGHISGNIPAVNRMAALSTISLFPQTQHIFQPEEPKPQHSYIGLIAMAILSSVEMKLVLSDIYQYILDNYPYFRSRGPGWRNSIRHNLSLNDCFIKSGRSANGKGHYWAIHPANMDDFRKGDFRRRKAQRKVRKHMGLSVDDTSIDSPSPPPLDLTTPPPQSSQGSMHLSALGYPYHHHYIGQIFNRSSGSGLPHYSEPSQVLQTHQSHTLEPVAQSTQLPTQPPQHQHIAYINSTTTTTIANMYSQTRKRQFDVASLLAPDVQLVDIASDDQETSARPATTARTTTQTHHTVITKQTIHREVVLGLEQPATDADIDTDIDVEVNVDVVDEIIDPDPDTNPYPDTHEHEKNRDTMKQMFSVDDNNSYLSDARRSSFDVDPDHDPEDLEPHNYSISSSAARSLGSSISQHEESNSLEECPIGQSISALSTALISPIPIARPSSSLTVAIPHGYIELNQVGPHVLSRYYGTYMAAAARRASLEKSKVIQTTSITPPPSIGIFTEK